MQRIQHRQQNAVHILRHIAIPEPQHPIASTFQLPDLFEPGADQVERDWQPWMRAVEQGLPEPKPEEKDEGTGEEKWRDRRGQVWTSFPPPAGFKGKQHGTFGQEGYKRRLSPAEQEVLDGWDQEGDEEEAARLTGEGGASGPLLRLCRG